ncbi:Cytochrome c biogenesis protein CcsA [Aquisphaera giovannonii]|uniref:Cytochrome c biogenesis protein CcsA n=1 Tax=Aquisphaera giovannonii TaxID=406548 RepID=A0A5B9VTZ4_9BACT|nr:cytochrome c biogenesis protein CcsA [Aquisphaera giovannonii]QEH31792.1 Cytochrome c biogenesis protein CcsA [Aquisphaera giovannonii]
MDRLQILCFAGTYGLALAAELARLVVRSPIRWHLTVILTALGWLVQTLYLANLAVKEGVPLPVTTSFESMMVLSWIVGLIGLYLMLHWPRNVAVGVFVLPLVLGLIAAAGRFAPRGPEWVESGMFAFWGTVHGIFLLAGAVCTCLAFAAGLMYLAQMRRLKAKRPAPSGFSLPSLEQSERVNRAAITVAFPLLTFGLLIGMVLSVKARAEAVAAAAGEVAGAGAAAAVYGGVPVIRWSDPKVVSALGMWAVFAALLHARFRPAMRGRSVMLLTIVAFAFLVFTWVGVEALRLPTAHGAARVAGGSS